MLSILRKLSRLPVSALLCAGLLAAGHAGAQQAADPDSTQRKVVDQKLRMLEQMLASPRVTDIEKGDNADAKSKVGEARQLVEQARAAAAGGQVAEAGKMLDDALRATMGASSAARGGGAVSASAQRAQNAELLEQVKTYRESLLEISKAPGAPKAAGEALSKVDRSLDEAQAMIGAGRYGDANRVLGEGYKTAVAAVTQLRAGQTVTLALKFDTPADEYAYEVKRNRSHELLVDMTLAEGRADGGKRTLVDRYVAESRSIRGRAEEQAKAGDHAAAIKTMEDSTGFLIKALQVMGLPVF